MTEKTPVERAVLDAMQQLAMAAEDYTVRLVHEFGACGQAVADAVRALAPPLPPEPPNETALFDPEGADVWVRDDLAHDYDGKHWYRSGDMAAYDWPTANLLSPKLSRLFPAADVAELVDALREDSQAVCGEIHAYRVESCPEERCVQRRALLARFASLAETTTPAEETDRG